MGDRSGDGVPVVELIANAQQGANLKRGPQKILERTFFVEAGHYAVVDEPTVVPLPT